MIRPLAYLAVLAPTTVLLLATTDARVPPRAEWPRLAREASRLVTTGCRRRIEWAGGEWVGVGRRVALAVLWPASTLRAGVHIAAAFATGADPEIAEPTVTLASPLATDRRQTVWVGRVETAGLGLSVFAVTAMGYRFPATPLGTLGWAYWHAQIAWLLADPLVGLGLAATGYMTDTDTRRGTGGRAD